MDTQKLRFEQLYEIFDSASEDTQLWLLRHTDFSDATFDQFYEILECCPEENAADEILLEYLRTHTNETFPIEKIHDLIGIITDNTLSELVKHADGSLPLSDIIDFEGCIDDENFSQLMYESMMTFPDKIDVDALDSAINTMTEEQIEKILKITPLTTDIQKNFLEIQAGAFSEYAIQILIMRLSGEKTVVASCFQELLDCCMEIPPDALRIARASGNKTAIRLLTEAEVEDEPDYEKEFNKLSGLELLGLILIADNFLDYRKRKKEAHNKN